MDFKKPRMVFSSPKEPRPRTSPLQQIPNPRVSPQPCSSLGGEMVVISVFVSHEKTARFR